MGLKYDKENSYYILYKNRRVPVWEGDWLVKYETGTIFVLSDMTYRKLHTTNNV